MSCSFVGNRIQTVIVVYYSILTSNIGNDTPVAIAGDITLNVESSTSTKSRSEHLSAEQRERIEQKESEGTAGSKSRRKPKLDDKFCVALIHPLSRKAMQMERKSNLSLPLKARPEELLTPNPTR